MNRLVNRKKWKIYLNMILADHHNHACIQCIAGITGGIPQYELEIDTVRLFGVTRVDGQV